MRSVAPSAGAPGANRRSRSRSPMITGCAPDAASSAAKSRPSLGGARRISNMFADTSYPVAGPAGVSTRSAYRSAIPAR